MARDARDERGEAQTLLTMGSIYLGIGTERGAHEELCRAADHLDQAIRIFRQIGDQLGEGQCLWFMCVAFAALDPDSPPSAEVIDLARVALTTFRQFGDPSAELVEMFLAKWEVR